MEALNKSAPCAAWILRDEAQDANPRARLAALPGFATPRIARKTAPPKGFGSKPALCPPSLLPVHSAPAAIRWRTNHPVLRLERAWRGLVQRFLRALPCVPRARQPGRRASGAGSAPGANFGHQELVLKSYLAASLTFAAKACQRGGAPVPTCGGSTLHVDHLSFKQPSCAQ